MLFNATDVTNRGNRSQNAARWYIAFECVFDLLLVAAESMSVRVCLCLCVFGGSVQHVHTHTHK